MPARKKVSVETPSVSDLSQSPNGTSSATSFSSSTTSSRKSSSNKSPNSTISLIFSKQLTYTINRSTIDYKKLPKFIEEALRFLNTFNYPYEMFYELNGKEQVFSSRTDDTMKALKDICENDGEPNVDTVYFLAESKTSVKTFLAYNLDFIAFIIFLLTLVWFLFAGSPESKWLTVSLGIGLCVALYFKYLR